MQSVSIMRGIDRLLRKNSLVRLCYLQYLPKKLSYLDLSSRWKESNQVSNNVLLITFLFFSFYRFLTIINYYLYQLTKEKKLVCCI